MDMETPNLTFYNLGIAPKLLSILDKHKFVSPTPIQHKAIPIALQGEDVVGVAQTGTGKTLAFGIPTVQRLSQVDGDALILVPTRELALQVGEALKNIFSPFQIGQAVLIGGDPMVKQIRALRKKPRLIVATPGRLMDHMERGIVKLNKVKILILDEADRMFDMGFAPQVKKILRSVPKNRQTLLFSATMPVSIVSLATSHMKSPLHVEIAPQGTTAEHVEQELFIVKDREKKKLLKIILNQYRGSILLFTRTKIGARIAARMIQDLKHQVVEIHSDRSMVQRKRAIEGFKSGKFRILVATDIAARGIDVKNIELVINYNLPDDIENYVHRIGRTGRAGLKGKAISFASPDQGADIEKIEKMIKTTLPRGAHPEIETGEFYKPKGGVRNTRRRTFKPRRRGGRR